MNDIPVLISIRPKWCSLIAEGIKNVEVRKTCPKRHSTPFKCYIYCTQGKDRLLDIMREGDEWFGNVYHGEDQYIKLPEDPYWCGHHAKVVGEFVCDDIVDCTFDQNGEPLVDTQKTKGWRACVSVEELRRYAGDHERRKLYLWHISDLVMYNEPLPLSDFSVDGVTRLERPPQSWCYIQRMGGTEQ